MAKKKTRTVTRYVRRASRKARGFTIPIAAVLGFTPILADAWNNSRGTGGLETAARVVARNLTGYDPYSRTWSMAYLSRGLFPIILGVGVHRIVGSMLGVNRMLGQARVPFLRI